MAATGKLAMNSIVLAYRVVDLLLSFVTRTDKGPSIVMQPFCICIPQWRRKQFKGDAQKIFYGINATNSDKAISLNIFYSIGMQSYGVEWQSLCGSDVTTK